MSDLPNQMSVIPDKPAVIIVISTLGLSFVGGIAAIFGATVLQTVGGVLNIVDSDAFAVANVGAQVGFAVVAVSYLSIADEWARYLKIRWPTLEDIAWILVLPLLLAVAGLGLNAALSGVGVATPSTSHGAQGTAAILTTRPVLWAVAIPVLYLFAAPAEELLYRGVVQGRLRPHFGTTGVVIVSGVAFGMMHAVMGLVSSSEYFIYWIVSTSTGGLIWAFVYERTENLAVTALNHAMGWTISFSTLLPFL